MLPPLEIPHIGSSQLQALTLALAFGVLFCLSYSHGRLRSWCVRLLCRRASRTGRPLPDPDPFVDFDLMTAMTRDFLYANKTLRHPYHQVSVLIDRARCGRGAELRFADNGASTDARQSLD